MAQREVNVSSVVAGILFIVLGILFLLERAGVLEVRAAYVWPLILISLGVGILLGGSRRDRERHHRVVVEGQPVDRFWEGRKSEEGREARTEASAQVSSGEEQSTDPSRPADSGKER